MKNILLRAIGMLQITVFFLSLLTGLDYIKHAEVAYPNKAQGDGWYNRRPTYSMDLTSSPRPSFDLTAKRPINAISEEDEGEQFVFTLVSHTHEQLKLIKICSLSKCCILGEVANFAKKADNFAGLTQRNGPQENNVFLVSNNSTEF